MLEFTLMMMLATPHGAAMERIKFKTEDMCLDAITQLADKNHLYKGIGWNLDATCIRTGSEK